MAYCYFICYLAESYLIGNHMPHLCIFIFIIQKCIEFIDSFIVRVDYIASRAIIGWIYYSPESAESWRMHSESTWSVLACQPCDNCVADIHAGFIIKALRKQHFLYDWPFFYLVVVYIYHCKCILWSIIAVNETQLRWSLVWGFYFPWWSKCGNTERYYAC